MVTIKNSILEVTIDTFGAQLRSVKKGGKEFLWQGDPDWWEDTAPVLFPICSNLKDEKYKYDGKEYSMKSHGFAKNMEFEAKLISPSSACLTLKSNAETLKVYPFDFIFSVIFSLEQNALVTKYVVTNPSDKVMYYSVGSHEGYNCPEGVENYEVVFNKIENFDSCVLDGPTDL